MDATTGAPRTRSALLAVAAQAKKGLRAPATPKEHQLAEELAKSTEKSQDAQSRLDLASAVANQTKDADVATYSWALSSPTKDIAAANASYESALGEHHATLITETKIAQLLQIRQRRARKGVIAFREPEFDSDSLIVDDGTLTTGEELQQLVEALNAGSTRFKLTALTNAQTERALQRIFVLDEDTTCRKIHELVTDMSVLQEFVRATIAEMDDQAPRELLHEPLPDMMSADELLKQLQQRCPCGRRSRSWLPRCAPTSAPAVGPRGSKPR